MAKVLWTPAPTMADLNPRSCVFHAWGNGGSGKTRLALTAPKPLLYIHHGVKTVGVLHEASTASPGGIQQLDLSHVRSLDEDAAQRDAEEMWQMFTAAFSAALTSSDFRSIVIDTHTDLWAVLRMAKFGALKKLGRQTGWEDINNTWGSVWLQYTTVCKTRETSKDNPPPILVLIGSTKEERISDPSDKGDDISKPTGRWIPAGQKGLCTRPMFFADVEVQMAITAPEPGATTPTFTATLEKAWYKETHRGRVFRDAAINFGVILSALTGKDWTK